MSIDNPKDLLGIKKVPTFSVVPPASLIWEALAMRNGAMKYGPYNWRDKKVLASIYVDALMRHVMSWWDGEELASDSKVHHLAHAKACLGIMIDAIENGCLKDDRPKAGNTSALLGQYEVKQEKAA